MAKYIVFMADVQSTQVGKLRQAITDAVNAGETEIYLALSSGGGSVVEGLSVAAFLKSLTITVTTHNIGQTDSVANVIFAAGAHRYANTNSSFLFHGIAMQLNQTLNEHQLNETYENAKRLRSAISSAFSLYTGVPLTDVEALMIRDGGSILSSAEALTKTIVHEVRELSIPQGTQIITIGNA
jgi:ATP-dependent protease ClpP protease subunit